MDASRLAASLSADTLSSSPPATRVIQAQRMARMGRRRSSVSFSGPQIKPVKHASGELSLSLTHAKLNIVPPSVVANPDHVAALTELDLSHNTIAQLPDSITRLTTLAALDVSANKLTTLPETMAELSASLTHLDLSQNRGCGSLPSVVGSLKSLTSLSVADIGLTVIPAALIRLTGLTRLDLSRNRLGRLPRQIGRLRELVELDISHNMLRSLPPALGTLATDYNLRECAMDGNPFDDVLEEVHASRGSAAVLLDLAAAASRSIGSVSTASGSALPLVVADAYADDSSSSSADDVV